MTDIPLHRVKGNGKVDVWDIGPSRPDEPKQPAPVDEKLKGAERIIAVQEYADACDIYAAKVKDYARLKREHQSWHEQNGGPVKVELWGVDARHAIDTFPKRYRLDLPRGVKPGRAQIQAEEMAKAEGMELAALRERDPQFGKPQGIQP